MKFKTLADRLNTIANELATEPTKKTTPYTPYHASDASSLPSNPNVWIDRSGKCYDVGKGGHTKFAEWWFSNKGIELDDLDDNPESILENADGWLHVSSFSLPTNILAGRPMSGQQKDAIFDWMSKHQTKAHFECPGFSGILSLNGFIEKFSKLNKPIKIS